MGRIETDLLGDKEVPDEAYYGIHTLRAVENFPISGRTVAELPMLIRAMVQVKLAAALANRDVGVLDADADVADAIVQACREVLDSDRCLDQFPVDVFQGGAGTSVNMNTNEVLANLALEHIGRPKGEYATINPNDHVNHSQSTNDAYPTGFRLALDGELGRLSASIEELAVALDAKADEFREVLKLGRTQLQDAVPMSLGQEFGAFAETLREEHRHIERSREYLLEVNLGATAIGTRINAPGGYQALAVAHLAEITGRPVVAAPNLIEATSDTGAYVTAHAVMKRAAVKLGKACNDLRLLSSGPRAGLHEINLPAMQAGSSIMPAKVNPVIPEVVNQVCFKVFGNDVCVSDAAAAGQLQLNVMEPVIAQCCFESATILRNACDTLRERCIVGITANPDVCRAYVAGAVTVVTYLNDLIGHKLGDEVGREAMESGRSVVDVIVERGLVSREQMDEILSPENLLR